MEFKTAALEFVIVTSHKAHILPFFMNYSDTALTEEVRSQQLITWVKQHAPATLQKVQPLQGDASFRRYFRVFTQQGTFIAVDAPVDKEDSRPFIAISKAWAALNLAVPAVYAADLKSGFLLISDLGDELYWRILNPVNVAELYEQAIKDLSILQTCQTVPSWPLPKFDAALFLEELTRFHHWYLERHLKLQLNRYEQQLLTDTFNLLIANALEQPQVCVHRDYHSRNLLKISNQRTGIIDFQDALWGPVTYDLVSLLRDCYVDWPHEQVHQWTLLFYNQAKKIHSQLTDQKQFLRWFDLMGMQRHLKAIYIFARLCERDGNKNYLEYISRALAYVFYVGSRYPEFKEFLLFLRTRVLIHESDDTRCGTRQALRRIDPIYTETAA